MKAVKNYANKSTFRIVEYFDERHARDAADKLNFTTVRGKLLCVELLSAYQKHKSPSASPNNRWEVMAEVMAKMPLDTPPNKTPISPLSPGDMVQVCY